MDYHIDYSLRYSEEVKHKGLYKWCIREFDQDGEQVGRDQIPFVWSVIFSITKIDYVCTIEREHFGVEWTGADGELIDSDPESTELRHLILATLKPIDTRLSMFGTKRRVDELILRIQQGDEDSCYVAASVGNTFETDFGSEDTPDFIEVYLTTTEERFDQLKGLVLGGLVDQCSLRLKRVKGLYSEWSPGISASQIKVLAAGSEQQIEGLKDTEFEPPRLGEARGYSFQILKSNETMIVTDQDEDADDWMMEPEDTFEPTTVQLIGERVDKSVRQLSRKLAIPLWILIILQALILLT